MPTMSFSLSSRKVTVPCSWLDNPIAFFVGPSISLADGIGGSKIRSVFVCRRFGSQPVPSYLVLLTHLTATFNISPRATLTWPP